MRVRNYRSEDSDTVIALQRLAAQTDGIAISDEDIAALLTNPTLDARANAFIITDDDDELNTWGQAGTLDGIIGETVGYTLVQTLRDEQSYHLRCIGTVHPAHRGQHAGRALFVAAMNHARYLVQEFELEAEEANIPIYFEAFFPVRDDKATRLAARLDMQATHEPAPQGLALYRRELL